MQQKKLPLRKCIGCNESKQKKELVRFVKTPDGNITLDLTGKKNGRGAYICPNTECLKKAKKSRRLEKAFEMAVSEDVYTQAEGLLNNYDGQIL